MCKEYINLQTNEVLDLERVSTLKDNAMLKVKPELWIEWDFEKNNDLGFDIWKVTKGIAKKANWICDKHVEDGWLATVGNRNSGSGCPYCAGKKVLKGFNDMWTTNPELASLLANPEDGYKYMQSSNTNVDWKCLDCGCINKNKKIIKVNQRGLNCKFCYDGISYPEKFVANVLKSANIDFSREFMLSGYDYRYDFYIPETNSIIEVHGLQHYKERNGIFNKCNLTTRMKVDEEKEQLAKQYNIDNYIVIDARISDFKYIKKSIEDSELNICLSDEEYAECHRKSLKSNVIKAAELWNSGIKNINKISNIIKTSNVTVRSYLRKANEINLCQYNGKLSHLIGVSALRKQIVQLDTNYNLISIYDGIVETKNTIKIDKSGVSKCLSGVQKTADGYKWMYKEDYDKYIMEQNNKLA